MRLRRLLIALIALVAVAASVLSLSLTSTPAGALLTPMISTIVFDAATNAPWSNTELHGSSAYDTSTVTGDGIHTPSGTLTYSFFANNSCNGSPVTTDSEMLALDGTVPNSSPTAALVAGAYSYDASYIGDVNYDPAGPSSCEPFTVNKATPTTITISNLPGSGSYGGGFTATVTTDGDGVTSVTSNSTGVCTVSGGVTVSFVAIGTCSLTAHVGPGTNYTSADGSAQTFGVGQAIPTPPTISNLPGSAAFHGSFVASVSTNGDGTKSVTSNSTGVCTVSGGVTVLFVGAGTCSLTAHVGPGTNYTSADGSPQTFGVAPIAPTAPSITNIPTSATFGGSFVASVSTNGDGTKSVTSNSTGACTVGGDGLTVSFVGAGTCSLTAHVAAGTDYTAADGSAQTFGIGRAAASTPVIINIPSPANEFAGFTATVGTTGDGTMSVTSNSSGVCTVDPNGLTVTFVGFGTCSLTPSVAQGPNHFGATGNPQTFTVKAASHGYWLVGSDGGIFSFGTAAFFGSTGSIGLQRPVVGITPTTTRNGYWLVASDGGIFSFGDSSFYGSIPGLGLHPAGSGLPNSLNAPIVGMVPTLTGRGYFMVASDGGVFSFGDARFEGSCPGIGGCSGAAVTVMPDHSGNGYWVVTATGGVYAFGDAPFYGAGPVVAVPVVDAVATPDGNGYWLLYANGAVAGLGAATTLGGPIGYVNSYNPATAIFRTADGLGYWVAAARGDVFTYGSAPYLGGMSAAGLNGEIIAAFGF